MTGARAYPEGPTGYSEIEIGRVNGLLFVERCYGFVPRVVVCLCAGCGSSAIWGLRCSVISSFPVWLRSRFAESWQALLVQELLSLRKKEEQIRELQLYLLKSWMPSFG